MNFVSAGKNCELPATKKTLCDAKPCGVHGVCEIVNEQVVCECIPGFHGARCELSDMETNVCIITVSNLLYSSPLKHVQRYSVYFRLCVMTSQDDKKKTREDREERREKI